MSYMHSYMYMYMYIACIHVHAMIDRYILVCIAMCVGYFPIKGSVHVVMQQLE